MQKYFDSLKDLLQLLDLCESTKQRPAEKMRESFKLGLCHHDQIA